ncbi:hypothetical protein BDQ12DRAFT_726552 [Crucibulum laeve]|uniref:Uncharacterized protein n=1 Tax=Crucibulum laeve TaxID=68775 RepID=A0A5C3LPS5_9AGAR|nr:hypothetical protein BDQ12DRAFT_726552 [Crucibulum laeve]
MTYIFNPVGAFVVLPNGLDVTGILCTLALGTSVWTLVHSNANNFESHKHFTKNPEERQFFVVQAASGNSKDCRSWAMNMECAEHQTPGRSWSEMCALVALLKLKKDNSRTKQI